MLRSVSQMLEACLLYFATSVTFFARLPFPVHHRLPISRTRPCLRAQLACNKCWRVYKKAIRPSSAGCDQSGLRLDTSPPPGVGIPIRRRHLPFAARPMTAVTDLDSSGRNLSYVPAMGFEVIRTTSTWMVRGRTGGTIKDKEFFWCLVVFLWFSRY